MKSYEKILIFFVVVFTVMVSFAGSGLKAQSIIWNRVYGGPESEEGKYGVQTFDGGYIIIATLFGTGGGMLMYKLDQYGNEMWNRLIDTSSSAFSIHQTADSCLVISGTGSGNGILIKTDKLGNRIWKKYFHISTGSTLFRHMRILQNGGYIICGVSTSPQVGFVLKTDTSGIEIWQKIISFTEYGAYLWDVTESKDGYIYSAGSSSPKTLIAKLSPDGNLIWTKRLGSEGKGDLESANSIISYSKNELYLTGAFSDFYSTEAYFSKIDSSGNLLFQNVLPQTSYSFNMIKTSNGNFAIAGGTEVTSFDFLYLLIDRGGNIISRKTINSFGKELDVSNSIVETDDKGFLMTGYTTYLQSSHFDNNICIVKTDSVGNAPVGIKNLSNELPSSFIIYQNYPNPFNPTTKINYELRVQNYVSLKVYDALGNEIESFVNKEQNAGSYSVYWNASDYPSGVYFYKLKAESQVGTLNYSATKKMLLVK